MASPSSSSSSIDVANLCESIVGLRILDTDQSKSHITRLPRRPNAPSYVYCTTSHLPDRSSHNCPINTRHLCFSLQGRQAEAGRKDGLVEGWTHLTELGNHSTYHSGFELGTEQERAIELQWTERRSLAGHPACTCTSTSTSEHHEHYNERTTHGIHSCFFIFYLNK